MAEGSGFTRIERSIPFWIFRKTKPLYMFVPALRSERAIEVNMLPDVEKNIAIFFDYRSVRKGSLKRTYRDLL